MDSRVQARKTQESLKYHARYLLERKSRGSKERMKVLALTPGLERILLAPSSKMKDSRIKG
jgi:hypothetical protein